MHHTAALIANETSVIPHGKLPWFITASQSLASHLGHGSDVKKDTASTRSCESQQVFRAGGSKDSNQELDTVVVIPRDEKVLRKM